jgi:hypothetical protein
MDARECMKQRLPEMSMQEKRVNVLLTLDRLLELDAQRRVLLQRLKLGLTRRQFESDES